MPTAPLVFTQGTENLVLNPSFEVDLQGWNGVNRNLLTANQSSAETDTTGWGNNSSGVSIARSTAQALSGTASLAVTATVAGSPSIRTPQAAQGVPVVAGQVYTAVVSSRAAATGRSVTPTLRFWTAAGAQAGTVSGPSFADNTTGWQQGSVTAQAPANAATAELIVGFVDFALNEIHYVDAVGLFETPNGNLVANPDFENGIAGWNGNGSSLAVSSAQAYTGRTSMSVTGQNVAAPFLNTGTAVSGTTYTASCYIRNGNANQKNATMSFGGSSGPAVLIPAGAWGRVSHTVTFTSSGTLQVNPTLAGISASDVIHVDAVQVVVSSQPVEYLPPTTSNLNAYPSFELNTNNWNSSATSTIARDATTSYVGTASLKVTATAAFPMTNTTIRFPYGALITLSAYVFMPNGSTFTNVSITDDGTYTGKTIVDNTFQATTTKGQWTRISVTYTGGTKDTAALVIRASGGAVGEVFYVDAVQVELGSVATPYVDGSLGAGYVWEASENLLSNPSFEVDVTGWDGAGDTLIRSTVGAVHGTASGELVPAKTQAQINSAPLTLTPSTTYTVSGSIFAPAGAKKSVALEHGDAWGHGGTGAAKNAASPPLIDLDDLGAPRILWLPGTAGNYVSTPDVNEIDYDSSTFENGVGRWEGLNKNLLTANQSSLETDLTGWDGYLGNTSRSRSTAQSLTGTASLALTAQAAGALSARTANGPGGSNGAHAVVPGQVYTAQASFRAATTARGSSVNIAWRDSSGVSLAATGGTTIADHSAGWQQSVAVGQAPIGAVYAFLYVGVNGCAAGEVHYVDAVGLFETPNGNLVSNPDFENGTAGWTGVVNASLGVTADAYTGRLALDVTSPATGDSAVDFAVAPSPVGTTLTVSAYLKLPTATHFIDFMHNGVEKRVTLPFVAGVWQRVIATFLSTTGTPSTVRLVRNGAAANTSMTVDAVQVVVGSQPVEYLPSTTSNLVTNPSFETDLAGWIGLNGAPVAPVRSTAQSFTGAASASVTAGSSGFGPGTKVASWIGRPVAADEVYTVSAYIMAPAGTQYIIGIENVIAGNVAHTATGAWQRISQTFKIGTANARAGVLINTAGVAVPAGSVIYIDAVQMELGSVATPYVDGSLGAGYVWEASENLLHPSIAEGTGGWTALSNANTVTVADTTQAFSGGSSVSWLSIAAGNSSIYSDYVSSSTPGFNIHGLVNGQTYTFTAYVRSPVATTVHLATQADGGVPVFVQSPDVSVAANTWTRFSVTRTVPAGTTGVRVEPVVLATAASQKFYADAVQVEAKPYATAYAAPGTAHASTSRRESPWVLGGTSLETLVTAGELFVQGTLSLRVNLPPSSLGPHGLTYGAQVALAVAPGTTYILSASLAYGTSARFRVLDAATGLVLGQTTGPHYTNLNTRQFLTFSTGTATSIRIQAVCGSVPQNLYVDAVQLEKGSVATAYTLPMRITGDIDIRAHVALEDWTPGVNQTLLSRWDATTSWILWVQTDGTVRLIINDANNGRRDTTAAGFNLSTVVADGQPLHVRVTVSATAAAPTLILYTSTDGVTWTQRSSVPVALTTAPFQFNEAAGAPLRVGIYSTNNAPMKGKLLSASVRAGIDGTVVASYDATAHTGATYLDTAGKTWTINRSGDATAEIVDRNTWAFTGSERLELPDRDALDIGTNDFTVVGRFSFRTPRAVGGYFVDKRNASRTAGYGLYSQPNAGVSEANYDSSVGINNTGPGIPPSGEWFTMGMTLDRDASKTTWLNGTLVNSSSIAATNGENNNSNASLRIGQSSLISWVALFRRVLTSAEHAELAAWSGRVATEPTWLRTAATLYLNADDPQQSRGYRLSNEVRNLARVAAAEVTGTGGWQRLVATGSTSSESLLRVVAGVRDVTPGQAVRFDAFQVEGKPYATAFAASGAAHASTSRRQSPWVLGGASLEALDRDGASPSIHAVLTPGVLHDRQQGMEALVGVPLSEPCILTFDAQGVLAVRVLGVGSEVLAALPVSSPSLNADRPSLSFSSTETESVRVQFLTQGPTATPSGVFRVDRVQVQTGVLTEYVDGTEPGTVWTGTPHLSTSRRAHVQTSETTLRLYDRLPEYLRVEDAQQSSAGGRPLLRYLSLVGDQLGEIERFITRADYAAPSEGGASVVEPDGVGGYVIRSVDTSDLVDPWAADVKWLRWLGRLVGVNVPPGLSTLEKRDAVAFATSGFRAGTKEAIAAAARSALTGTKHVEVYDHSIFEPGDGGPWDVLLITRGTETPDVTTVLKAVVTKNAKPAGVVLHHRAYDVPWDTVEATYSTWAAIEAAGSWNKIQEAGL